MPEHAYVYILASSFQRLYIGVTSDLDKRIAQHREGAFEGSFTSKYRIDKLVYFERLTVIGSAIAREKQLKRWSRIKKLNLIVASNPVWQDLSEEWARLSNCGDPPLRYHLAMASATALSIAEYHETSYRPDREYIDGELRERNVGKRDHARVQALLGAWFVQHETEWSAFALTEQRVQVTPSRVRIPDVLLTSTDPQTETLTSPPILVVEILSPEDTYSDTQERARDYLNMGVEMVWVIDPPVDGKFRTGRMCREDIWQEARILRVPGMPIHVDLDTIFQHMTELRG